MSILEDCSVCLYTVRKGLEEGRALGLEQGRQQEACTLLMRLLERLEALGEAVLDCQGPGDLNHWLSQLEPA